MGILSQFRSQHVLRAKIWYLLGKFCAVSSVRIVLEPFTGKIYSKTAGSFSVLQCKDQCKGRILDSSVKILCVSLHNLRGKAPGVVVLFRIEALTRSVGSCSSCHPLILLSLPETSLSALPSTLVVTSRPLSRSIPWRHHG